MGSKVPSMGKSDIGSFVNPDANIPEDAKKRAMRRTMLARKLNTGRCTTPQELSDRFNSLFETCIAEGFLPNVEMLALCSRLG